MNKYLIGFLSFFLLISYMLVGCKVADVATNVVIDTPTNVDKRGFEPVPVSLDNQVPLDNDELMNLYSASYALLIGESDYTNWSKLESVPSELNQVEKLLKSQGFHVIKKFDLDSFQLKQAFEDFINQYGLDADNRLLFFFSGHGYTRKDGDKGYIVPIDVPNPELEERQFIQKAIDMEQVTTWARKIESKHALFLFDSCFSGIIFKAKSMPKIPKYIDKIVAKPVRQFITAGSADETVPAKSVFTPAFIDAIQEGKADINNDGFITGNELGVYLTGEVPLYTEQTPQFGRIKEYDLAQGDFVFTVSSKTHVTQQNSTVLTTAIPHKPEILRQNVSMQSTTSSLSVVESTVPSLVRTVRLQSPVRSITISPDGKLLAAGNADATIKLFELISGKEILSWKGHQDKVLSIAFNPDGSLLASGGSDGATYIWETNTGKLVRSFEIYNLSISAVTFSPDGTMLAATGGNKNFFGNYYPAIKLWDVYTGREIRSMTSTHVHALEFSSDGQLLASAQGSSITLWKVSTGEEISSLEGHLYDVHSLSFSPNGLLLASGSDDRTIILWSLTSNKVVHTFKGHSSPIWSVKFSPDGQWLISGSGERFISKKGDYVIKLWNISTGREIYNFEGHDGAVFTVFFSKDGQLFASGSEDNTIKLWHTSSIQ